MTLSDLMQRNVELIPDDLTVRAAARQMSKLNVGVLPVSANGRVVGMLTDRDIVIRSIARGDDPDKMRVGNVMTPEVEACHEDDSIEDAARHMSERQIQRLLVLDREDRVVGIISLGDLSRVRDSAPAVSRTLEDIKAPTKPSAAGAASEHVGH